eukprot:218682-Prorocentrum_lima.AAC.1
MEAINDIRNAVDADAEQAAWLAFLLFDKFMLHAVGTNGSMNQLHAKLLSPHGDTTSDTRHL